jgi:hypothetical protein
VHPLGKAGLLGRHPRQLGVVGDHVVDLTVPGQRKFLADPEPVQRRIADPASRMVARGWPLPAHTSQS